MMMRKANSGYGLMLAIMLLAMCLITIVSLQLLHGSLATAARCGTTNVSAYSLAMSGFQDARADISGKLDAGTLNTATYSLSKTLTAPSDPSNFGSSTLNIGSYTATITQSRGNTYLVKVVGTVGLTSITLSRLMEIIPTPVFDCSATETKIKAGTLSTISDTELIAYARNNCMIKTAPPGIATSAVTVGTGSNCTSGAPSYNSSGTLNLGSITATCNPSITGSYSLVKLATIGASTDLTTYNVSNTNTATREIDVDKITDGLLEVDSTGPVTLKLNSINAVSGITDTDHIATLNASSTQSIYISITGDVSGSIDLTGSTAPNTVIIGGNMIDNPAGSYQSSIDLGNEGDTFYVNTIKAVNGGTTTLNGGADNDLIYFNNMTYQNIFSGAGDDIISCTGLLGNASCTQFGQSSYVYGQNDNDIISIDAILNQTQYETIIDGGADYNIIYLKGINNTSGTDRCTINATSSSTGKSLVIIGGNMTGGSQTCRIIGSGSNNILLVKTGSTSSNMNIGASFRTIYY